MRADSCSTIISANIHQAMNISHTDIITDLNFEPTEQNIQKLRIIQNRARTFILRKRFIEHTALLRRQESETRPLYFTREEHEETLRKRKIGKVQVEKREAYKYKCSKAIYDGEWLGGMRHGTGKIKWADGAIY